MRRPSPPLVAGARAASVGTVEPSDQAIMTSGAGKGPQGGAGSPKVQLHGEAARQPLGIPGTPCLVSRCVEVCSVALHLLQPLRRALLFGDYGLCGVEREGRVSRTSTAGQKLNSTYVVGEQPCAGGASPGLASTGSSVQRQLLRS